MFDTVILLSGPVEQLALPQVLLRHNPLLRIIRIETAADFPALTSESLRRTRLIAFATPVIVPRTILDRLGYGAINFHPGPPSYPGWAPAHFAVYHRETEFGTTAHVMIERVDAGPIIDVETFPIPAGMSPLALEELAYAHLAKVFWRLAKSIATESWGLPTLPLKWGAKTYSRRDYRAMCDVRLNLPTS
jgi:methionyl-tRNA formyltransferase